MDPKISELFDANHEQLWRSSLLDAHLDKPWQPEPLYELARQHRLRGMPATALEFALRGVDLPWPDHVDELVRRWGFKAEIATLGWHSSRPEMRELGHRYSEELALDREFPRVPQDIGWRNLFWYTKQLSDLAPSLRKTRVEFEPPKGFYPLNPSICRHGSALIMVVRAVNYRIGPAGLRKPHPCITRNFLFHVDRDISRQVLIGEIEMPYEFPQLHNECLGFEDMRLWTKGNWNELWCSATDRQHNVAGWCQIVVARINSFRRLTDWQVMLPNRERHEKNWVPIADGSGSFIYSCDPVTITKLPSGTIGSIYDLVEVSEPPISAHHWCGSSQAIPFDSGLLAIVHERPRDLDPELHKPPYRQRFIWLDRSLRLRKWSWGWELGHNSAGEYVAGLCEHPDGERLVISYGVLDAEAWLATVTTDDVRSMLRSEA